DLQPPVSQLTALPALAAAPTVQIPWSATDDVSGAKSIDLYYAHDGGAAVLYPGSPFTTTPIGFASTTTGGDGTYAFFARAHDAAGNIEPMSAAPKATTRIDTTAPPAPAVAALASYTAGTTAHVAWTGAGDAVEFMAEASTTAGFGTIVAHSAWITAQQFDFVSLGDGTTYFFRVKARDAARNESAYAVQSTTLDDTAPASAVAALVPVTTSPAFTVAWSGTDATSGVASVDLFAAKDGGAYKLYAGGPWTA